ncbi:hypothetical protein CLV25_12427, partial [Acetobacteroides hydrogenigenes]
PLLKFDGITTVAKRSSAKPNSAEPCAFELDYG